MEAVNLNTGPTVVDKLTALRRETFDAEGTPIELVELTGLEATEVWGALDGAEASGNLIEAYALLVLHGARHPGGGQVFESLDQVRSLPARYLVPMGERMLQLCDMGLDAGNAAGAPDEI